MKKSLQVLFVSFAALFMLAACGNKNVVDNPPAEEKGGQTSGQSNVDQGQIQDTELASKAKFKEFELNVEYANDKEFSVDFDTLGDMEASIEDEINGKNIYGDDAMVQLNTKFDQLTFTKDTSDNEVIKEVLQVFNLDEKYQDFELDVHFDDGTKKEYKNKK
ncbi:YusW family protein [Peribacillus huizhouensis]|uniref:Small lipoprotein YifL n=1 Tax=Peribacillus huizhouensis TaxID=1501239 RepID=A0ABR6CSL7_9BACI|nr:YusW family protein [Peribacillus huizhouensis]MBA9027658.1 putative small lipoprotein YifL [Peribacillus huizhouensis]